MMRPKAIFNAAMLIIGFGILANAAERQRLPENATVQDLQAACASDDPITRKDKCDTAFYSIYLADLMTAGGPSDGNNDTLCLPIGGNKDEILRAVKSFQAKILAWIHDHPETMSKSVFDGTWAATLAVYTCKQGEPARW